MSANFHFYNTFEVRKNRSNWIVYRGVIFRPFRSYCTSEISWLINRDSSVSIVTGCGLENRGLLLSGAGIFVFFVTMSSPAQGATQIPIHWEPRDLFPGVKPWERETDHSPPSSVEFKNPWSFTPRALVNTIMNFRVPLKTGNFLISWVTTSFSKMTLIHWGSYDIQLSSASLWRGS